MGAEGAAGWGPPALVDALRSQLRAHGFEHADVERCAHELEAQRGPAARASLFVDLGASHFLGGATESAVASWRHAAVSGQPAPAARALYNLGRFHQHLGLFELAISQFDSVVEHRIEPYWSFGALARARAELDRGNLSRALAGLARLTDDLLVRRPESRLLAEALLGMGDVAGRLRRLDRAEQAYRAVLSTEHEQPRAAAMSALIDILRARGRDDEAQQLVDQALVLDLDPVLAIDRIELLVRLGRIDEATVAVELVDAETLGVPDRFRLASILLDMGDVNGAIDELEVLSRSEADESRARAIYLLGEVYLAHEMFEPARTMLESVSDVQPGYWADKASLALGDLEADLGDVRAAAIHWAAASASGVESIATGARKRLVSAVDAGGSHVAAGLQEPSDVHVTEAPLTAVVEDPLQHLGRTQPLEIVTLAELDDDVADADAVLVPPVHESVSVPGVAVLDVGEQLSVPDTEDGHTADDGFDDANSADSVIAAAIDSADEVGADDSIDEAESILMVVEEDDWAASQLSHDGDPQVEAAVQPSVDTPTAQITPGSGASDVAADSDAPDWNAYLTGRPILAAPVHVPAEPVDAGLDEAASLTPPQEAPQVPLRVVESAPFAEPAGPAAGEGDVASGADATAAASVFDDVASETLGVTGVVDAERSPDTSTADEVAAAGSDVVGVFGALGDDDAEAAAGSDVVIAGDVADDDASADPFADGAAAIVDLRSIGAQVADPFASAPGGDPDLAAVVGAEPSDPFEGVVTLQGMMPRQTSSPEQSPAAPVASPRSPVEPTTPTVISLQRPASPPDPATPTADAPPTEADLEEGGQRVDADPQVVSLRTAAAEPDTDGVFSRLT